MTDATTIEGNGTEIVRQQPAPAPVQAQPNPLAARAALWGTDNPAEIVKRATEVADALTPILREKGMVKNLGGDRDHVMIQGWQTLGSLTGVVAAQPWTREIPWPVDERLTKDLRQLRDSGFSFGYEAGFTALTLSGIPVGGGEGTCKRTEPRWATRPKYEWRDKQGGGREKFQVGEEPVDDFALKAMAQTRAQSRCLASPLRFIVELAGFSGTPAEEMTEGMAASNGGGQTGFAPGGKQEKFLRSLLSEANVSTDAIDLVCAWMGATMSGGRGGPISEAIDSLKKNKAATAKDLVAGARAWEASSGEVAPGVDGGADDDSIPLEDEPLPDDLVDRLYRVVAATVKFERLCVLMAAVGANQPKLNRRDSIKVALRALTPEQADGLEARLNAEADRSGS